MKDITGYAGLYSILADGRVYSHKTMKFLRGRVDKYGYLNVILYKGFGNKNMKVHRLVAEAFLPNPRNLPQVHHVDGVKTNNHVDNLEWCTAQYNVEQTRCRFEHVLFRDGKEYRFKNIRSFSREHDLCPGDVSKLLKGKLKSVKKFYSINSGV